MGVYLELNGGLKGAVRASAAASRRAGWMMTAAVLAFAAPCPVLAQAAASPAAANAGNEVSEVVVTANKRAEVAIHVANAVSSVSGNKLVALGFTGQQDLSQLVPGLSVIGSDNGVGGTVIIRGISTSPTEPTPTVGTVIDGVPVGGSTGFGLFPYPVDVNFFDLDRVEVLRGPQGTLYGANTLSGLVSYVTKAPSLTAYSGGVDVRLSQVDGAGGGYSASGGFTGPLIQDKLGVRASAYYDRTPGYLNDPALGLKDVNSVIDVGARISFLATPTAQLKLGLTFNYQNVDGRSDDGVNYSYATKAPTNGPLVQNLGTLEPFNQEFKQVYGSIDYDAGWGTLTSLSGYSVSNNRKGYDFGDIAPLTDALSGGAAPTTLLTTPVITDKVSEEVRLTSPDAGPFRWIVGGFYTHESTTVDQELIAITATGQIYAPLSPEFTAYIPTTFQEYAGFANATYDVTSRLQLGAGLRVSHDDQTYQQVESGPVAVIIGAAGTSLLAHSNETIATYSASARYSLEPNTDVYFRTSTGYRPGGPNLVVNGVPPTFGPDNLTNYELGLKSRFWDNRATVELTAFYEDYHNIQLSAISASGLGYRANGKEATSKGIEFSTSVTPLHGLNLGANLTLLEAKLDQAVPDLGAAAGERLPGSADVSGSLTAEYHHPVAEKLGGFVGGVLNYTGNRTTSFDGDKSSPQFILKPYTLLELHVGVQHELTTLTLSAKNLTNDRAELGDSTQSAYPLVEIAPPRSFMVELRQLF